MGRPYSLAFQAQTIAAASGDYDLFEISPADDRPIRLHHLHLGQTSELGDAQEEELRIAIVRGHATTGNGTSTTPAKISPGDAASVATCKTVGSTIASAGTAVTLDEHIWNIRSPFELIWLPEDRPVVSQAEGLLVVRLMAAVADDMTMSGTLYFEEMV